jgi:hypothetical protein
MGLTISYKLSTRRRLNLAGVKKLLAPLRAKAATLSFDKVGEFFEVGPDYTWAFYHPPSAKTWRDLLPPSDGVIFSALPGNGSESVELGLCRYEGVPGWQLRGYCKTQYASRHGWEHFLKCHRRITDLLRETERLGLRVRVDDEGEFWETGSPARLRARLEGYDCDLAAFGGALRDAARAMGDDVQGPIFGHPRFEHLEAEGIARNARSVRQAVTLVKRLPQ